MDEPALKRNRTLIENTIGALSDAYYDHERVWHTDETRKEVLRLQKKLRKQFQTMKYAPLRPDYDKKFIDPLMKQPD